MQSLRYEKINLSFFKPTFVIRFHFILLFFVNQLIECKEHYLFCPSLPYCFSYPSYLEFEKSAFRIIKTPDKEFRHFADLV